MLITVSLLIRGHASVFMLGYKGRDDMKTSMKEWHDGEAGSRELKDSYGQTFAIEPELVEGMLFSNAKEANELKKDVTVANFRAEHELNAFIQSDPSMRFLRGQSVPLARPGQ